MKKILLLATIAILTGSVAFANGEGKNKSKKDKARTEKNCTKPCPKPCPPCCDNSKCSKN